MARWHGREIDRDAEDALRAAASRGGVERWSDLAPAQLAEDVLRLIGQLPGPIAFDLFVAVVAESGALQEPRPVYDTAALISTTPPHDRQFEDRETLLRVWAEIRELPIAQRAALLLNLRSANGTGLLWLMPVSGIATIRQIAEVLNMPAPELAAMWKDLPIDDVTIAWRLGCARQQVINLRMAARKRLGNRLRALSAVPPAKDRSRANLARLSASLEGGE